MTRIILTTAMALTFAVSTYAEDKSARKSASAGGNHAASSLTKMLGSPDEAFKLLDVDSNGGVDKQEFADVMGTKSGGRIPADFSNDLFGRVDQDADGAVSIGELQKFMSPGEAPAPARKSAKETKPEQETPVKETKSPTVAEPEVVEATPAPAAEPTATPAAKPAGDLERRGSALAKILGPLDAASKKIDADGDGKFSKEEFAKYVADKGNGRLKPELALSIFSKYDADGDKFLSLDELRVLLPAPGDAPAVASASPAGEKSAAPAPVKKPKPVYEPRTWKSGDAAALPPAKLDQLLDAAMATENRPTAPQLDDERFLRRATLDLTGKPPTSADVQAYLNDTSPTKLVAAVDRLLASDDFSRHWGHVWRDVMQSKASSTQVIYELHRGKMLEDWLSDQFRVNRSWADITRDLITAQGTVVVPIESTDEGNVGLLLCHTGADAEVGRAIDVSRVFLGMQLECAQCHDHPTDVWKREQFHEFAAYFGRLRDGKPGDGKMRGVQLTSAPRAEYEMPDRYDAVKKTVTHPKFFLTGEALGEGKDDATRRGTLADLITANPWFAKAFVNRVWSQFMGRGFVEPIDNLGPNQVAVYPEVLDALSASFIASGFNVKELLGTIAASEAYQRQIAFGENRNEHIHFAGAYPMRLRGEELWDSLATAVGPFAEKTPIPDGLREVLNRIRDPDFFTVFKRLYDYDPTLGANEVESGVAQALMLLNNEAINAQIRADGDTPLARIAAQYKDDDEAVRQVYLQVLTRHPVKSEMELCHDYMRKVGDRREALEDLMWTLVNSAEFKIKH